MSFSKVLNADALLVNAAQSCAAASRHDGEATVTSPSTPLSARGPKRSGRRPGQRGSSPLTGWEAPGRGAYAGSAVLTGVDTLKRASWTDGVQSAALAEAAAPHETFAPLLSRELKDATVTAALISEKHRS